MNFPTGFDRPTKIDRQREREKKIMYTVGKPLELYIKYLLNFGHAAWSVQEAAETKDESRRLNGRLWQQLSDRKCCKEAFGEHFK